MSIDIPVKRYYLKQILYFITKTGEDDIGLRGDNIDGRDLKVIETFMGTEFVGANGTIINTNEASILEKLYTNIENYYFNCLNFHNIESYLNMIFVKENSEAKKDYDFSLLRCAIEIKTFEISDENTTTESENTDTITANSDFLTEIYSENTEESVYDFTESDTQSRFDVSTARHKTK
jgi:hypothetical protein